MRRSYAAHGMARAVLHFKTVGCAVYGMSYLVLNCSHMKSIFWDL